MSAFRIDPMRVEDLDEVLAIERVSFTNPWSRQAFLYELRDNRVANLWVVRLGTASEDRAHPALDPTPRPAIVGYLCLWWIADEVHVTNLAVRPDCRQQGIAGHVLATLLEHYRQRGATRVALEVRPSNVAARRLYEGFGFYQVGRRKGYYFDTGEDALLMEAPLGDTPASGPGKARNYGAR